MAKFNGFDAQQEAVVLKTYREARRCLETIVVNKFGTSQFRQVFGQIMGGGLVSTLQQAEAALEDAIRTMHLRIAGQSFDVTYEATFTNTNADMLSVPHSVTGGGSSHTSFVDEARQEGQAADAAGPELLPDAGQTFVRAVENRDFHTRTLPPRRPGPLTTTTVGIVTSGSASPG